MRIDAEKAAGSTGLDAASQQRRFDSAQRLQRACEDFEAIFLRHLLEKMRATLPEGGLLGNTQGEKIFRSMLDGALADEMAKSGHLGLGRMLYQQLKVVLGRESAAEPLKAEAAAAEDLSE